MAPTINSATCLVSIKMNLWSKVINRVRAKQPGQQSFSSDKCMVALLLPLRSGSLHFRSYAERIGTVTILRWAVDRIADAVEDSPIRIIADSPDEQWVKAAAEDDRSIAVWRSGGLGSVQDIATLMRVEQVQNALVVDLSAALLPSPMLKAFLKYHCDSRSHASCLYGVPCALPPLLFQNRLLADLTADRDVPSALLPGEIHELFGGLERIASHRRRGSSIVIKRVSVISPADQIRRAWPHKVSLTERRDVEILRLSVELSTIARCGTDRTVAPLDHWNRARVIHRARAQLVEGTKSLPPSPTDCAPNRVLYVQGPSAFSGGEQVLLHMATGMLASERFRPCVLVSEPGVLTDKLESANVDTYVAERDFATPSVDHYRYARKFLRNSRPGIVHAHSVAGVPFCSAIAEQQVPFVQHVHVASDVGLEAIFDQVLTANVVIAVSAFVRTHLVRFGADPGRIHVIHNGVPVPDVEWFEVRRVAKLRRAQVRSTFGIPPDAYVILMPARFAANKRHDVALDAFLELSERLPAARLIFAGEAFSGDRLTLRAVQQRIARLHARNRVIRVGFRERMEELYACSDVVFLPSEDDPLPLTVLEAMAGGVPVIGARSGGTPEMIDHAVTGLLGAPGDATGFAKLLQSVLVNRDLGERLASEAFQQCQNEFGLQAFLERTSALYEAVSAC